MNRRTFRARLVGLVSRLPLPVMIEHPFALLLLWGAILQTSSQPESPAATIAQARRLILQGYYDRASEMLDKIAAAPEIALPVTLARAEIDERIGGYRQALERLRAIESAGKDSADWQAAMAAMSAATGEYDAAITHGRRAIEINRDHHRARYELGQVYETLGRDAEAIAAYKRFNDLMTLNREPPEGAEALVYTGRGFLRYSTLTRHPEIARRCKHTLQHIYQEVTDYVDEAYWPARLAIADLLLEKHKKEDAEQDYARVRQTNARVAEADIGLARAALEDWNFELVEKRVAEALNINPNSVAAQVALGQARMLERRYSDAAACAQAALKVNPNSIDALSLLAAAQLRQSDKPAFEITKQRIDAVNPKCAMLHHTLGVWLAAARQYEDSEAAFKKAIEFAPWWSEPRAELGLMYMQSGQEDESHRVLTEAMALDPFHKMASDVLLLLNGLRDFARHETEHFVIRYDEKQDAALIPFLADHLEAIHGELCEAFDTRLDRKTVIEVFPSHNDFSVRIAGRPWIHTVGACTGPVIAIDAPRRYAAITSFNWAEVLRHEFTHTVTLAATQNRIPHWMTEGLAVHQENPPRPWTVCEMLSGAVRTDRLFTLETIDWGFMRPRRADDRSLAYAQSQWMIEFIVERWKHEAIPALLKTFREGATQEAAFRSVLKIDPKQFIDDFRPWAEKQVASWGLPTARVGNMTQLKAAALIQRTSADVHARLAEAAWYEGDPEAAESAARTALESKSDHPLALLILGRLLVQKAQAYAEKGERESATLLYEEADSLLGSLCEIEPSNPVGLKHLAYVEQWKENYDTAMSLWQKYREKCPADPAGYQAIAGIHLIEGRREAALPMLEHAFRLDKGDPEIPRQIAEIYHDKSNPKSAAEWLRRAVEIDPYHVRTYLVLGELHEAAEQWDPARKAYEAAIAAAPRARDGYDRMAAWHRAHGDAAKADEYAKQAEERKPLRGSR